MQDSSSNSRLRATKLCNDNQITTNQQQQQQPRRKTIERESIQVMMGIVDLSNSTSNNKHQYANQHQHRQSKQQQLNNNDQRHHQRLSSAAGHPPTTTMPGNIYYETTVIDQSKAAFQSKCSSRLFIAECLGTLLLVYLGQTAVTSFELIGTQNDAIGRLLATILARSLALLFATMLTIKISGAHLNPAYSLATAIFNYTSFRQATSRIIAQYLGAFLGAILLHLTYYDKLNQRHTEGLLMGKNSTLRAHGNLLSTGKFFSSFPPTEVSHFQLFTSYMLANVHFGLLSVAILESNILTAAASSAFNYHHTSRPISTTSQRSNKSARIKPLYMALAIALILAAFSANGGPVLNPAQDFSTRFYMLITAWGWPAFNLYHSNYWWLCGLVAPHAGFIIGFGLFRLFQDLHDDAKSTSNQIDSPYARRNHHHQQLKSNNHYATTDKQWLECQDCSLCQQHLARNGSLINADGLMMDHHHKNMITDRDCDVDSDDVDEDEEEENFSD